MTKLTIPQAGEYFLGNNPSPFKLAHVSFGDAAAAGGVDVAVEAQAVYQLIDIPAGTFVLAVFSNVDVAINAVTTLTIGDGSSAAGFLASADIAPQAAVATGLWKNSQDAAEAFASGKYYAAADTIDVTVGAADVTAGKVSVYVLYTDAVNL